MHYCSEGMTKMQCKQYIQVRTAAQAVELLNAGDTLKICMAGGTDIIVKARKRNWYENMDVIDIGQVDELCHIKEEKDSLLIGAGVKIADLCTSALCREYVPVLAKACGHIGSPQIRNRATIGGNIANGCLAADSIPALTLLGASVRILGKKGFREVPAEDFIIPCTACLNHEEMTVGGCFYGVTSGRKNVLDPGEIVTEIRVPKRYGTYRYFYQKVGRRNGFCMSKFTLAFLFEMKEETIRDIRLSVGAAFADMHLRHEADRLIGMTVADPEFDRTAGRIGEEIAEHILSQRAKANRSLEYKAEVCRRLVKRSLIESLKKTGDEKING